MSSERMFGLHFTGQEVMMQRCQISCGRLHSQEKRLDSGQSPSDCLVLQKSFLINPCKASGLCSALNPQEPV